jgi:catechol 2,3-dioxygenase-like lactoylglutathione lyase family enzyme
MFYLSSVLRFGMTNFIQITPFMVVPDIEKALPFFTDLLGFKIVDRHGHYAYVHRETVGFRILQSSEGNEFIPGNRRFAHYIDVKDVDALYAELKPKLDKLPLDDVHGPADKNYGQRELLILAPDGNVLAFGHAVSAATPASGESVRK